MPEGITTEHLVFLIILGGLFVVGLLSVTGRKR